MLVMAPSTPTGLLVLAMLVGQVAGFARVPKELAEKGGNVRASRMHLKLPGTGGKCVGPNEPDWKDSWGDGCDWYAKYDVSEVHPGRYYPCTRYKDYGQWEHCPVLCDPGCVQTFLCGAGTTMGENGKCEPNPSTEKWPGGTYAPCDESVSWGGSYDAHTTMLPMPGTSACHCGKSKEPSFLGSKVYICDVGQTCHRHQWREPVGKWSLKNTFSYTECVWATPSDVTSVG